MEHASGIIHLDSESDGEKSMMESRTRQNGEWKGLARDVAEPPPLQSSEIDNIHEEDKIHCRHSKRKRSYSPRHWIQKKQSKRDELKPTKAFNSIGFLKTKK